MSDDIVVVTALLVAEGLIESNEGEEPSKFRLTQKGYKRGLHLWETMGGENRLLLTLFLKTVKLI